MKSSSPICSCNSAYSKQRAYCTRSPRIKCTRRACRPLLPRREQACRPHHLKDDVLAYRYGSAGHGSPALESWEDEAIPTSARVAHVPRWSFHPPDLSVLASQYIRYLCSTNPYFWSSARHSEEKPNQKTGEDRGRGGSTSLITLRFYTRGTMTR